MVARKVFFNAVRSKAIITLMREDLCMTGIMVGELHAATEQLQKMVNPNEDSSLCECLRRGPSKNLRLFSRALSDLEAGVYDVVARMQKVADKGLGEKEEQAEVKKASGVITSATALLEETRSKFHIHEYPAGLSFWQKAVISVKKFFGFFTRTRYVEISTTPVDVQKISADVHVAMTKEFAKTLPLDFSKKHGVAITLAEKKVEPSQPTAVVEVTEQGDLRGTVEGKVVQASTWKELGERIDDVREGVEEAQVNRALLMKELNEKALSSLPSELPEGSWYIRKKNVDAYVFCQKGQPQKEVKITEATTAKSINELFGVEVSDDTFIMNVLWAAEKQKLDQKLIADEAAMALHGGLLKTWMPSSEVSLTYMFVSPGEQAGEKEKASLRIGVGESGNAVALVIDDNKRLFRVKIEEIEYSASTFDELQKQINAAIFHDQHLCHINYALPIAEKRHCEATEAIAEFARAVGGEVPALTQEAAEETIAASSSMKGLVQEGMTPCRPWKDAEGKFFLTVLKEGGVSTFPLDFTSEPGKIILSRDIDKGGDIILWPQEAQNSVKGALEVGLGVSDVLFPVEFEEIQKQVGPQREEIMGLEAPTLGLSEFSSLVRSLGKNAKNAYLLRDIQDRTITIHWWDGEKEHDVVIDIMSNPGKFTVSGKDPYLSLEMLLQGEIGCSKTGLVSAQTLLLMADQLHDFVHDKIHENPLYVRDDPSNQISTMSHRIELPQAWWIAPRGVEEKGSGVLGAIVNAGGKMWDRVSRQEPRVSGVSIENKYGIKVWMPEGEVQEIPLPLVFVDGHWAFQEGGQAFDTIEKFILACSSELGIDPAYSHVQIRQRFERHQAVEHEIESSGVGTGKVVLKKLAGLFTAVFLYKYFQGAIADVQPLVEAMQKDATFLKKPVGCIFKSKDQHRYHLVICNKEKESRILDLEIDSKSIPGSFGLKGGKKFTTFAAFRDEVMKDVVAFADAENAVKKNPVTTEASVEAPKQGLPQPVLPSGVAPPAPRLAVPEARPVEDVAAEVRGGSPARPEWLDVRESWVTVGKGKRLDKDIRYLIKNVDAEGSLVSCEPAGSLNTDERAFHAWVKALGGASEKLGAQDLEDLERITRELPLLERFWLFEVAVNPRIISGSRQEKAIHALEHCLKANIKRGEDEQLVAYLAAHKDQYGNARTKEEAIAFLKKGLQK